jgi:hypothetical protein
VLDKINASLIPLLFKPFVKFDIAYSPPSPLGDICVLSIGIRARSLILGFTALRAKMSARGLVHNDTFIFDGTNYDSWKIHMLNYFRVMDPSMERCGDPGLPSGIPVMHTINDPRRPS